MEKLIGNTRWTCALLLTAGMVGLVFWAASWMLDRRNDSQGVLAAHAVVRADNPNGADSERLSPTELASVSSRDIPSSARKLFDVRPQEGMTREQVGRLCAVNCLYVVCRYYNVGVRYDQLVELLQPTTLGVSVFTLREAAEGLGFQTMAVQIESEELLKFTSPVIVLLTPESNESVGHYCISLSDNGGDGFWLFDPPNRKLWVDRKTIENGKIDHVYALLLRRKTGA
jgi:hypothetical protein